MGWRYIAQRVLLAAVCTAPAGVLVLTLVRQGSGQPLFVHATPGPRPHA